MDSLLCNDLIGGARRIDSLTFGGAELLFRVLNEEVLPCE
jgi:hypothetical protein